MTVMNSPSRISRLTRRKHPGLSGASFVAAFEIFQLDHFTRFMNRDFIRNEAPP